MKLRGSILIDHTLATKGAERLWNSLHKEDFINALGALTGNQAVQQVKAGLQAIYLSGWQVAADANLSGQMYPDQSLYPANSVPVRCQAYQPSTYNVRIKSTMQKDAKMVSTGSHRLLQMQKLVSVDRLNVFELMKGMIEAGAAGVHLEDQLASEKKCGHLGGKVLLPTQNAIRNLVAARLAADVLWRPDCLNCTHGCGCSGYGDERYRSGRQKVPDR